MNLDDRLRPAIEAAVAAGSAAGHDHSRPVVLQHTNNVVVWLSPHPIVAKVGVWPHSRTLLERESELCAELERWGSPAAVPLRDRPLHSEHGLRPGAGRFGEAQLPVSLWRQLSVRHEPVPAVDMAVVLRRVHVDLERCDLSRLAAPLPSYLDGIALARDFLGSEVALDVVAGDDLTLLLEAFDRWFDRAADWPPTTDRPLHGEPHSGNVLSTSHGLVVIDFEMASVGPVEWDLASMSAEVVEAYGNPDGVIDPRRLALLRALNRARLATWCVVSPYAELRGRAPEHLAAVRAALDRAV